MKMAETSKRGIGDALRRLLLLGVLVLVAGYACLRFTGCKNPLAQAIGVYDLTVTTLPDYCDYLRGEDLYDRYGASVLGFDCDQLRDDLVKDFHQATASEDSSGFSGPEAAREVQGREQLLRAWRQGTVLHIANPGVFGKATPPNLLFSEWKQKITELATKDFEPNDEWFCVAKSMQTLFTSVEIHGGNKGTARFNMRRREKLDPCGPPGE